MTDEERRKLCEWLRDYGGDPLIWEAADEIERLAAEVARLATIISGNVRLVEELDDGAIFEIRHLRGS